MSTLKRAEEWLAGITPGEWKVMDSGIFPMVYGPNGERVCRMARPHLQSNAVREERDNAAFIAAAPSLVCELSDDLKLHEGLAARLEAEVKALREENDNLRTALSGRTYCHSDEAVNAELRKYTEAGPNKSDWCPVCKTGWGAYPREKMLRQQRDAEITSLRGVVEKVRTGVEDVMSILTFSDDPQAHILLDGILSIIPEVPK